MGLFSTKRDIPVEILEKWQKIVDVMAKAVNVPTGLIMRVDCSEIEVFVSSHTKGNPFNKGERAELDTGLYCQTVLSRRGPLLVPNAVKDPEWAQNPDVDRGMISYYGLPLQWPDGKLFGTICILDRKENVYSEIYKELVSVFQKVIENDLQESLHWDEVQRFTQFAVDHLSEAAIWILPDGGIIYANNKACSSLDLNKDELISKTIYNVVQNIPAGKWSDFFSRLQNQLSITFESTYRTNNGRLFPVEVICHYIVFESNEYCCAFVRDVSDRKKMENDLVNAFSEIKKLKDQLEAENIYLKKEMSKREPQIAILGHSEAIKNVLEQARQVADTDSTVLLLGETGTGKELLANTIHNLSSRKNRTMIKVNCATLPATLLESELFGREKGAYTGASTTQKGRFEIADGSTIFLDEIAELPLELQSKFLRILQENQFERLGSPKTIHVNIRVIAATNQDLDQAVSEKKFRQDLFYRLNVFPITLPPLRERKDDIPFLVGSFVKEFENKFGKKIDVSEKTMAALQDYPWPGNVRELRSVIERAMILSKSRTLEVQLQGLSYRKRGELIKLEEIERHHILQILEKTGWRVSGLNGAAELLGLKPTTLESRMKKLGIRRPR